MPLLGGFDPLALIDALARHAVQYVIVGGWAAIQHGAVRRTDDLDICPQWSRENLDRLRAALSELDAQLASRNPNEHGKKSSLAHATGDAARPRPRR